MCVLNTDPCITIGEDDFPLPGLSFFSFHVSGSPKGGALYIVGQRISKPMDHATTPLMLRASQNQIKFGPIFIKF
jgi:hypothetical protein